MNYGEKKADALTTSNSNPRRIIIRRHLNLTTKHQHTLFIYVSKYETPRRPFTLTNEYFIWFARDVCFRRHFVGVSRP